MTDTRFGMIALLGAPNVGKSTLVNRLVGAKVSIATPKEQTTRARVMGLAIHGQSQLALIDTPGIFTPKTRLDRAMVGAAHATNEDADATLHIIDGPKFFHQDIFANVRAREDQTLFCVINKIDMLAKDKLLEIMGQLAERGIYREIIPLSALSGDGCSVLLDILAKSVAPGPWHFPQDQLSDMNNALFAAEITREQIYLQMQQELPYAISVVSDSLEVGPPDAADGGEMAIYQTIYVERESQKGMVIGKGGQRLKKINTAARLNLEKLLDCRVHLFTNVKTDPDWKNKASYYQMWNLPVG